ncbi:E3 ubiquitin-protein ligase TRIM7 [Amia ocellicauda]|uniref:E3 ubiquitin-protein ligase TRIM7 n=1 Tax=Amia ocellicauda TaxID=2972642 RepID=UPI0034638B43
MTSLEEAGLAQSLANEVTCPLCSSLFRDPVRLDCEHNYCRQCILDYWREGGGERERGMEGLRGGKGRAEGGFTCPLCREIFPQFTLKANKLLAKIVERMSGLGLQYRKPTAEGGTDTSSNSRSLLRSSSLSEPEGEREGGGGGEGRRDGGGGGGGGECSLHREPLKVYCVEEGVAICVVCAVSREHKTHSLAPIEEILTHWEESFEGAIRGFEQQKEILETLRREKEKQITELKDQAASLRAGLVSDIDRLLQFLEGEKGALCTRLDTDLARLLAQREGTLLAASQEVTRLQQEVTSLRGQLGQEVRNAPVLIKARNIRLQSRGAHSPHRARLVSINN